MWLVIFLYGLRSNFLAAYLGRRIDMHLLGALVIFKVLELEISGYLVAVIFNQSISAPRLKSKYNSAVKAVTTKDGIISSAS